MILGKYSVGVGDRFGQQGEAQLRAVSRAWELGVEVTPVWNKSHREHVIVGTDPADVRQEADAAVNAAGWTAPYHVDADHIGLDNVDLFVDAGDFFTLDVADYVGTPPDHDDMRAFLDHARKYVGTLALPGLDQPIDIGEKDVERVAHKYLSAVREAGRIYRHIADVKGADTFITEVSIDETDEPQTPTDMLLILAAVAEEGIPAQTIAPKFTGRFNKGVDYVGDVSQFAVEFDQDLAVVAFAVREMSVPQNLKLSVHSGSDKFSIYGPINRALRKFDAGVHLKTAGTTWLEEIIGLAAAGGEALDLAKEVYRQAYGRFDELCGPYATVIDIDRDALPAPETVDGWDSAAYTDALRHDQTCDRYDLNFRQLLHVGYKVAAEMGDLYIDTVRSHSDVIGEHVAGNILDRHIKPLFISS